MRHSAVRRERRDDLRETRTPFEVVTGGGLDALARRGVSREFVARLRAVLVVAAFFIVLGVCRVTLVTSAVTLLQGNTSLKASIESAQALNDDLQVERSVLSSASRINRIASQNYGMVLSTNTDRLVLAGPSPMQDSAEGDVTKADATTTDGEAAQPADATVAGPVEA